MAKGRLTLILLVALAVAAAFWWQERRVTRAEENVGLDTSRTIIDVFSRVSALDVADLHGEVVAVGMDDHSCGLFTATQTTRAPYRVGYFIDLSRLPRSAYRWNERARVMAVDVPDVTVGSPNIDAGAARTRQTGACVSRRAGQAMQLQVARRLNGAVARSANSPAHLDQARASARAAVAALVRGPLAAAGMTDVGVAVRFPGEAKPAALSVKHWNESRPLADVLGTH